MLQEWADYLDGLRAKTRQVPALSFSWEIRRSRHPAWTGISVCPGCVKGSETSSPATTPSGPGIPQARSRACLSYLPGGVAGVSKGTKETGKGKEKRQRKVGEGTGKTGTAAEGTPENSRCPPCPARAFPAEYRQHFLKAQGQEEKAALRDSQPQPEKQERLPRFKHWLGKRTPYLAHIWRFRKRIAPA